MIKARKMRERIAKALAARACSQLVLDTHSVLVAYYYAVIPGEKGEFVEARYKIPTSGDVTGNENAKCQGRKWVHSLELGWSFR
jgi:hypothetical protein